MPRRLPTLLLIVLALLVTGAAGAVAPSAPRMRAAPVAQRGPEVAPAPAIVLRALDTNSFTAVPPPPGFAAGIRVQTATITVAYSANFPQPAREAFQHAVNIWQTLIASPVPIQVNATWTPLSPATLGSAGPTELLRDFPNAPVPGTWYPVALANKLAGNDLRPGISDITVNLNNAFPSWYFGTDGNTPPGQYDFVSVALHELGHGLGFVGSMQITSGQGTWGFNGFPLIYDRFTETAGGQKLLAISPLGNPSFELALQLTSNALFFNGPNAVAAGGTRPRLYAPGTWQDGSSYAHLDEATYPAGNPNSLMTPAIGAAESIHSPGPITLGIFQDMGWTAGGAPPPPGTFTLTVTKAGAGSGTVTSTSPPSPAINCGQTCSASYPSGTVVTLAAMAGPNSTFAGWSGACSGTGSCTVTMNADASVTATFNSPPPSFTLTVSKSGTGTGTVTSTSPPSPTINCGPVCSAQYPSGTVVTLVAMADATSTFTGWSGACSGTGSCSVPMDANNAVMATFTLTSPPPPVSYTLSVSKFGTGVGTVTSTSPPSPSITCGGVCSAVYPSGTTVVLAASPGAGSAFAGWSGACSGTGSCTVTMNDHKVVMARFDAVAPPCGGRGDPCPPPSSFMLSVAKTGSGTGTVTSTAPASPSITCGTACSAAYPAGTVVTLVATPAAGSTFAGWSGACTGTGTCQVVMDGAKSVTATFNAGDPPPATFTLTVMKAGSGAGTVMSTSPPTPAINCGTVCQASYASGTVVTLVAAPHSGSTFAGWGGACSGTGACTVTMNSAQSVTATFSAGEPVRR